MQVQNVKLSCLREEDCQWNVHCEHGKMNSYCLQFRSTHISSLISRNDGVPTAWRHQLITECVWFDQKGKQDKSLPVSSVSVDFFFFS